MELVQEEGTVIEVHEEKATVRVDKSSACVRCKAGCMDMGGDMVTEAKNLVGARAGDTVILEHNPKAALNASLATFGIPLLALLLGVILGSVIANEAGLQEYKKYLSIGGAALMFFLSFIPIKFYDRHIEKSGGSDVILVEILRRSA